MPDPTDKPRESLATFIERIEREDALEHQAVKARIAELEAELKLEEEKHAWTCEVLGQSQARVQELEKELREAQELATEALEDEDFQPCYDQSNHIVGPALRGVFERINDAAARVLEASKR